MLIRLVILAVGPKTVNASPTIMCATWGRRSMCFQLARSFERTGAAPTSAGTLHGGGAKDANGPASSHSRRLAFSIRSTVSDHVSAPAASKCGDSLKSGDFWKWPEASIRTAIGDVACWPKREVATEAGNVR